MQTNSTLRKYWVERAFAMVARVIISADAADGRGTDDDRTPQGATLALRMGGPRFPTFVGKAAHARTGANGRPCRPPNPRGGIGTSCQAFGLRSSRMERRRKSGESCAMRTSLLTVGGLIIAASVWADPASGQEPKPPMVPPGLANGLPT